MAASVLWFNRILCLLPDWLCYLWQSQAICFSLFAVFIPSYANQLLAVASCLVYRHKDGLILQHLTHQKSKENVKLLLNLFIFLNHFYWRALDDTVLCKNILKCISKSNMMFQQAELIKLTSPVIPHSALLLRCNRRILTKRGNSILKVQQPWKISA